MQAAGNAISQPDILDSIRESFRYVAANAQQVGIHYDRLADYAASLPNHAPSNTFDDQHHFLTTDREQLAAYILTLEAVNFGSGYKPALAAEGWPLVGGSIYFTVSSALKKVFEGQGGWSAKALRRLTPEQAMQVFSLPDQPTGKKVATLFSESLNGLGVLLDHPPYSGSFLRFVEDARGSAARMVRNLSVMEKFNDTHAHYNREGLPILKRAQHAAASLHTAFSRIGPPLFSDIGRLTMFADNAVPHVLRMDGILEYTPWLTERIDSGEYLLSGTSSEVEIRCCAGEAVERIAILKGMTPVEIDYILWHRSVEHPVYRTREPHRALSVFY